jgi:hypothetical protein
MPSPDPVAPHLAEVLRLLDAGDWGEIERTLRSFPEFLASLPEQDRERALRQLDSLVQVLKVRVRSRSDEVGAEILALRKGRNAARHYRDSAAADPGST